MPHSLTITTTTPTTNYRTKHRAQVHTPTLQSIDTSSGSIDSFKRQHEQSRPFVQGGARADADIFGIHIPVSQPASSSAIADPSRRRRRHVPDSRWTSRSSASSQGTGASGRMDRVENERLHQEHNAGSGRESLEFESTLDGLGHDRPKMDATSAAQEGREWPPSPKKSPVKRKLVFNYPGPVTSDTRVLSGAEIAEEDNSLLDQRMRTRRRNDTRNLAPEDNVAAEEEPSALPSFMLPRHEHVMASTARERERKSLMRRRRTTAVHEDVDPIMRPRPDQSMRVSKPKSRQSSAESKCSSVGVKTAAATALRIGELAIHAHADPSGGLGLKVVEDTPRKAEVRRVSGLEEKLWDACGHNVRRWNRGDFSAGLVSGFDVGIVHW